jgi:hypothetical protein
MIADDPVYIAQRIVRDHEAGRAGVAVAAA